MACAAREQRTVRPRCRTAGRYWLTHGPSHPISPRRAIPQSHNRPIPAKPQRQPPDTPALCDPTVTPQADTDDFHLPIADIYLPCRPTVAPQANTPPNHHHNPSYQPAVRLISHTTGRYQRFTPTTDRYQLAVRPHSHTTSRYRQLPPVTSRYPPTVRPHSRTASR